MSNPFEKYTIGGASSSSESTSEAPSVGAENPFEKYTVPKQVETTAPAARATAAPTVGVVEDIDKTIPSSLARGITGLVGLPGAVQQAYGRAADAYLPETVSKGLRTALGPFALPSGQQLQSTLESGIGKPLYEPQTRTGKFVGAGFEALPSAAIGGGAGVLPRVLSAVGSGIGGEAGAQAFEGTKAETPARVLGGVLGGVASPKAITPYTNTNTAARQAQVDLLKSEGIPLRAGQALGSPALQRLEEKAATRTGGIGAGERINEQQATAFERAVTDRAFPRTGPTAVTGNAPDPTTLAAGRKALDAEYNRLKGNYQIRYDNQLRKDMDKVVADAGGALPNTNKADVARLTTIRDDITDKLLSGQGKQSGAWYQQARSDLGKVAQSNKLGNANLYEGAKGMQRALDDAMGRALPPQAQAQWKLNNQRWSNMKALEDASGRVTAGSRMTPQNVIAAQKVGRKSQFARQTNELDRLAVAARDVAKPLPTAKSDLFPSSMRALRTLVPGAGGAGVATMLGGPVAGAAAAIGGAALSPLKQRAVLSGPGQKYLGNQLGPIQAREAVARALLAQAMRGR